MNSKSQKTERGNALIYVLIAIALFAALSMTLGRQTDSSEAGALSDEKAELLATQLISYAAQTKLVLDQMIFTGDADTIDNLVFTLPTGGTFNSGSHIYKVYHPEGGGLNPASIPAEAVTQINSTPAPGWYLWRFNNVEWTSTAADDVILVAHQISQKVCQRINLKVTGSTSIPVLGNKGRVFFIYDGLHVGGTNADFDLADCASCAKYSSLCAIDTDGIYDFYTIVADQ